MAAQAVHLSLDLADIRWIHHVGNRMPVHGVAESVLQRKDHNLVEVVFRQFDFAVKNRDQVRFFQPLRLRVGAVALEAELVDGAGAQQMLVVAAMSFVTGRATLGESRLVVHFFLAQLGNIAVAIQADADCIRFWKAGLRRSMRVMAAQAVACLCTGMRNFGGVDSLRLLVVSGHAQRLAVSLREYDLAIFRRRVAHLAAFVGEGGMLEFRHQLRGS